MLRCYVASPLGFTEGGRAYYRDTFLPALAAVVEPVDPWGVPPPVATDERARWLAVGARNAADIRSCALLVAYLEGQEPDSGTVAELGYAAGLGLRCFGLRSDLRCAGEPGMALNLQVEAFVLASGGIVATSLAELCAALRAVT